MTEDCTLVIRVKQYGCSPGEGRARKGARHQHYVYPSTEAYIRRPAITLMIQATA
jgi:hypothetical protein